MDEISEQDDQYFRALQKIDVLEEQARIMRDGLISISIKMKDGGLMADTAKYIADKALHDAGFPEDIE